MEANNQQINQNTQEDVGRLRQVRRDKLSELQAAGRDPFQIVKYDQTHHTKDVRDNFDALEFTVPVDEEGKAVASYDFGEYPPQEVVWNGISSNGTMSERSSFAAFSSSS